MRCSHSSRTPLGRAFSAGKLPTMPALHCAITNSGPETMNSGEPVTGRRRRSNGAGRVVGIGKLRLLFETGLVGGAHAVEQVFDAVDPRRGAGEEVPLLAVRRAA